LQLFSGAEEKPKRNVTIHLCTASFQKRNFPLLGKEEFLTFLSLVLLRVFPLRQQRETCFQ